MPRNLLQILVSIAILSMAYLYFQPSDREQFIPVSEDGEELPRTYIDSASSWSFDDKGALNHMIEAEKIQYFTGTDESQLTKPRFFSRHDNDLTWSAFAETGRLQHNTDKLELTNQVVLRNDESGGRLETRAMLIDISRQVATSEDPVTYTEDKHSMRADSMVTNLNSRKLQLSGTVESVHDIRRH